MAAFLLLEDGSQLLAETGDRLIIDELAIDLALVLPGLSARSNTPIVRVLFLDAPLGEVLEEVRVRTLVGSVSMDRTRDVERQATLTLANQDGRYTPASAESLVWPGRIVRVERGLLIDGIPEYVPLITGVLSAPSQAYAASSVSFTVWSRLRRLDRQFPAPLSFDAGTSIGAVVRTICELAGLGTDDALYDLDDGGTSVPVVRSFDVSDNMLRAVRQYCADQGLDGPYDVGTGVITLRPFRDPSTADVEWEFGPGQYKALLAAQWSLEERTPVVFNRQDVVGVAPDRYPVYGSARDLNPSSPTYNPPDASGPLGDVPAPAYVSADIHDEQTANAVALRMLYERALADLPVRARALVIATMKPRSVVHFAAGDLDVTAQLDALEIPVGPGDMSLAAQGVRSLVAPV